MIDLYGTVIRIIFANIFGRRVCNKYVWKAFQKFVDFNSRKERKSQGESE